MVRPTSLLLVLVLALPACRKAGPPAPARPGQPDAGFVPAEPESFPAAQYPTPAVAKPAVAAAVRQALTQAAADRAAAERLRETLVPHSEGRTRALLDVLDDAAAPRAERRLALLALELLPSRLAAPRLARECVEGTDADLVAGAADALAATGDARGAAALEVMAGRRPLPSRRRAVFALSAIAAGGKEARRAALAGLRRISDDEEGHVREAALRGLVSLGGPDDVWWFEQRLRDGDMLVRRRAVEGLARHGGAGSLPALTRALTDPFPPVVAAAARGLERLGDRRAVPALTAYLQGKDRTAVDPVLRALGKLRDPAALRHVVPFLFDRDGYLRTAAARTLADIGDPAAVPHLLAALDTELVNARIASAEALGTFGDKAATALDKLRRLARDDPHVQVREAAAGAVRRIEVQDAGAKDGGAGR